MDRAISCLPFELCIGPFVHGRLQNLKTSDDTFGHVITPLTSIISAMISSALAEIISFDSLYRAYHIDTSILCNCSFHNWSLSMAYLPSSSEENEGDRPHIPWIWPQFLGDFFRCYFEQFPEVID